MRMHRAMFVPCFVLAAAWTSGARAEGAIVGEGQVKTDSGELVRSGGRTWACLGAAWQDEGTVAGGTGTLYSCAGAILDSATYTTVSVGRTDKALAGLKADLQEVARNVSRNGESIAALQLLIDTQCRASNDRLHDEIAARFDAIPGKLLANKAVKDAVAKLKADVLAAVKGTRVTQDQSFSKKD